MSYRNITVENVTYKYVVGKTHTKIRNLGVFLNTDIGNMREIEEYCECCGESMSSLYPSTHVNCRALAVTPADVAAKIKSFVKA